jgi:glycosyltransferase involved in cell wall biosynthesis
MTEPRPDIAPTGHPARVLMVAAACNPYKGSDSKVGWGRVQEAAKYFDTWVICGAWDQDDICRHQQKHGHNPRLHFLFVEEGRLGRLLRLRTPLFSYTNLLSYHLWQRRAYQIATKLHGQMRFALTHQVTLTGYRQPGYLWKLDAPFVWGPVGGTQNFPPRFFAAAGLRGAVLEGFRSLANWLQLRFSPSVRRAARKAAILLAANSRVQGDFQRVHRLKAEVLPDVGLFHIQPAERLAPKPRRPLRLLWSGAFKHHKALPLLLQALPHLPAEFHYELRILGKGPLGRRWQKLAKRLGVAENCRWLGWLPYEEALKLYEWADIFVFTSLRDTLGSVVLEALSFGVPVICLDHQGAGEVVTEDCGIKIPVTTPTKAIRGFRDAIVALATDPEKINALSRGALKRAEQYRWSRNGEQLARYYSAAWRLAGRKF